ncbi:hypothetical protein ACQEV2_14640 [Streptomyces sp. CA-251387]|uniref:hypothetical protein n=1 Tax=Streptomyces sp. CA-251387 TaxID=3240064 RepID=UPI003D8F4FE9
MRDEFHGGTRIAARPDAATITDRLSGGAREDRPTTAAMTCRFRPTGTTVRRTGTATTCPEVTA